MTNEEINEIFKGVKITFSKSCYSGLLSYLPTGSTCQCWRCREERGEPFSQACEDQAAETSMMARRLLYLKNRKDYVKADAFWQGE